jgi:hypothetical protein
MGDFILGLLELLTIYRSLAWIGLFKTFDCWALEHAIELEIYYQTHRVVTAMFHSLVITHVPQAQPFGSFQPACSFFFLSNKQKAFFFIIFKSKQRVDLGIVD